MNTEQALIELKAAWYDAYQRQKQNKGTKSSGYMRGLETAIKCLEEMITK